ncbi:MAG: hypothetical protein JWL84_1002 [Rhodospirillales bacterium]|jgi:hypothetical protein|nr:hypothetical protein [Rhodospirillales bacterium]
MITLFRANGTLSLPTIFWEASQVFARQEGWRPAGVGSMVDDRVRGQYIAGRMVGKREAADLADALERVVNGKAADSGELDIVALVELINFLRVGGFGIR